MITLLRKHNLIIGIALSMSFLGFGIISPQTSLALTGSDFKAGRIIEDGIFYNGDAMAATEVQNFLNTKVSSCDTNGTQNTTRWYAAANRYYTRAEWGTLHGNPPPYTCLRNYSESTPTKSADAYCTNTYSGGVKSAAQIINEVSRACGLSQKSMLVLLQKEQSLVTDDWPWNIQYRSATGYGCPDTAACDSQYYGFFNQVYNAARQFQRYAKQPNSFNYRAGQSSYIRYNPNADCGGTNVYIHNSATAGLYNYTPYQPNAAALTDLYGNGDLADPAWPECSAFGNRNFWRMFNDWFGLDPNGMIANGVTMNISTTPTPSPARGQTINYVVSFTNHLSVNLSIDAIGVVGRLGNVHNGANRDMGWVGPVTLNAGATQQFTYSSTVRDIGTMYFWPAINYQGTYVHYNAWGSTVNSRQPNLTLSQPLVTSTPGVYAGQNVTFTATLKNNESAAINYDAIGIPVRFYDHYNYDATWVGPGTISAGGEVSLSGTRNIDKPGPFSYWVSNYFSGSYTTIGVVNRFNAANVAPNFSVSGISFSPSTPTVGGNLGASFSVTNNLPVPITVSGVGIVGRYNSISGANRDIGWQGPVTFSAGETKSFSGYSRTITDPGAHYYWIGVLHNGSYTQYNNWGSTVVSQSPSFTVSGLSFNTTSPAQGSNLTTSFTVRNNLSIPVTVDGVGVVGRYNSISGANRDIGWQGPVTFSAGETKSFSGYSRTITEVGPHYYWIGVYNNGGFIQYNNWGSTVVSRVP